MSRITKYSRQEQMIRFRGQSKPLREWCAELGLHPDTVRTRLKSDWSLEDALTTPPRVSGPTDKRAHSRQRRPQPSTPKMYAGE